MKKLILALAAMLIATPAVAYDGGATKGWADACSTFLRYTQDPPPEDWSFEGANHGKQCWWHVIDWLIDSGHRPTGELGEAKEMADGRCGAQIIVRYNNDTPVFDALAAEFDTACGEPPAIM